MVKRKRTSTRAAEEGYEKQRMLHEGWAIFRSAQSWEPPTDVYENDEGLVVLVEIAGVQEEDFRIVVSERQLIIEGVRLDPEPKRTYHQMEVYYGPFRTEVLLPWSAAPEEVTATYEDGLLRILFPRPPVRRVPVSTQGEK